MFVIASGFFVLGYIWVGTPKFDGASFVVTAERLLNRQVLDIYKPTGVGGPFTYSPQV
jgi:hypothetical protein